MKAATSPCVFLFLLSFATTFAQPIGWLDTVYDPSRHYHRNNTSYAPNCNRTAIITDYLNSIDRSSVTTAELNWTGNVIGCIPGTISDFALEKTLTRINYFRRLVGVHDSIIFRSDLNSKCQLAALMMRANNTLSHTPPDTFKCYTAQGAEAAGKSNLSSGPHSSAAINQYVQDLGSNNTAVGHRRWILYHRAKEFGFGSTSGGTALWVIGSTQTPKVIPEYIAYPSPDYFPKPLIYPRWSFSVPGGNFTKAKISMKDEKDNPITLSVEPMTQGFGDNTVVWVPVIGTMPAEDKLMKVKIDSVLIGSLVKTFEYTVLGINPTHQSIVKKIVNPCCGLKNGSIKINYPPGYKSIRWSNGIVNQDSITGLGIGTYYVRVIDKLDCELIDSVQFSSLTAIADRHQNYNIKVTPNPASDKIEIQCDHLTTSTEIIDNTGRILMIDHTIVAPGAVRTLPLAHLVAGTYYVRVRSKGFAKTVLVVKI